MWSLLILTQSTAGKKKAMLLITTTWCKTKTDKEKIKENRVLKKKQKLLLRIILNPLWWIWDDPQRFDFRLLCCFHSAVFARLCCPRFSTAMTPSRMVLTKVRIWMCGPSGCSSAGLIDSRRPFIHAAGKDWKDSPPALNCGRGFMIGTFMDFKDEAELTLGSTDFWDSAENPST